MAVLQVTHVVDSLNEQRGGMPRSALGLCEAISASNCKVNLCAVDLGSSFGPLLTSSCENVSINCVPCRSVKHVNISLPKGFRGMLMNAGQHPNVIHSHGIWSSVCNDAAVFSKKLSVPHVISPRGMLEESALRRSAWKKAIAKYCYVLKNLKAAQCIHALTAQEAMSVRRMGLKNPIAIIPNGISLGPFEKARCRAPLQKRRDKKTILFIGRIHPIKGLKHLLIAWARIKKQFSGWEVVIAGPDDDNHLLELQQITRDNQMEDSVIFRRSVYGKAKEELLHSSDIFVLPSFSEGFSMVLLEAMASRLPVVISSFAGCPEVVSAGAGLLADPNANSFEQALTKVLSMKDEQRLKMGSNASALVTERFQWDAVAAQTISLYGWLQGAEEQPGFVHED